MKQLTVQEALQNIDIVVSNARMTGPKHDALKQSIELVTQRCKLADELEKANQASEEGKKEVDENEESD